MNAAMTLLKITGESKKSLLLCMNAGMCAKKCFPILFAITV